MRRNLLSKCIKKCTIWPKRNSRIMYKTDDTSLHKTKALLNCSHLSSEIFPHMYDYLLHNLKAFDAISTAV